MTKSQGPKTQVCKDVIPSRMPTFSADATTRAGAVSLSTARKTDRLLYHHRHNISQEKKTGGWQPFEAAPFEFR